MLSHAHCRSPCNAAFILPACTRFLLHHMFKKDLKGFCLMVQMLIFFFRSHPAPDMSFLLIYIQNLSGIPCQRWMDLLQSFRDILMYGCDDLEWFYLEMYLLPLSCLMILFFEVFLCLGSVFHLGISLGLFHHRK